MIAISYRREDSLPITGRLYDRLQAKFGQQNVFMDFDSIPPGVDFREQIKQTIERSNLVIAVIGPRWLSERADTSRRIDDPADFVRLEIKYALERGIPVIPLLVDNTLMPKPEKLPAELEALAFRNALPLDSGIDFHTHAERLINGICGLLDSTEMEGIDRNVIPSILTPPPRKPKTLLWGILASVLIVGVTLLAWFEWRIPQQTDKPHEAAAPRTLTSSVTPPAQSVTNAGQPSPVPVVSTPASNAETHSNTVTSSATAPAASQTLDMVEDSVLNLAMASFLNAIRNRNTYGFLALFSKVQPWHYTNYEIGTTRKFASKDYTYKQLEQDLSNKKGLYWNFFTDNTIAYSYRIEVLSHPFESWRKIDNFTFRSPNNVTVNYVRWRKEQDHWVVSEISETSP